MVVVRHYFFGQMEFVRLSTVDNSFEANFLKEDLESEGIPCILTNENVTTLIPHMNGILGSGIQILVAANDFQKATEILTRRVTTGSVAKCPNCQSTNINFGLGTKLRLRRIISIVISAVTAMPFNNINNIYYCYDCRTEFKK